MRLTRVLVSGVICLASLLAGQPVQPATAQRAGDVGSAGIGDPYFPRYGNGGYRVRHYAIRVAYHRDRDLLRGHTSLRARTTQRLSRFHLDFGLHVRTVRVNGRPATWRRRGQELVITPSRELRSGAFFRAEVSYAGHPSSVRVHNMGGWERTPDGGFVVGVPSSAVTWFPSNDHPADKARYDIRIVAPHGIEAISNGRLVSRLRTGTQTVWHWRMSRPMATSLASVVIGHYHLEHGRTRTGTGYWYAVSERLDHETLRNAVRSLRNTTRIVAFYARRFGRYPFGVTGGIVTPQRVNTSVEIQTKPIYQPVYFFRPTTGILSHELAHQWFGDSVSLHRWRDIWLNEGWATWASWLWAGHTTQRTPNDEFRQTYRRLVGSDDFWRLGVADPGPRHLFNPAVYARGALAMQALRNLIGRPEHRRLVRVWVRSNRYGHGTIAGFERLAERVAGRDLDRFFAVWLVRGKPPEVSRRNGFPRSMVRIVGD